MSQAAARPRPKGHGGAAPADKDAPADKECTDGVAITQFAAAAPFVAEWRVDSGDWVALAALCCIALVVRCWRLHEPASVVFDEVHFGKFAGRYLNGTYFFDLHPPLAKLMFTAAGRVAGYDGVFDFASIGLDYVAAGVPYVAMRLLPAVLGALTVPLAFVAARACGYGRDTAALAAALVCIENGLVTQSRLILLDSPLVFFTALTLACWAVWWTHQRRPFTRAWWGWLAATGVALGCAASCKWVGLFLFPALGLSAAKDLWDKIADRTVTPARWMAHAAARAAMLLGVPAAVYLFWFWVHFSVLHKTGPDALMMTPEFQASLDGGSREATDRDVYYGSEIRIRTTNGRRGFLHSHQHAWQHDKGSGQQQVTLYGHADFNNVWVVERAFSPAAAGNGTDPAETGAGSGAGPVKAVPVRSGDVLRLRHKATGLFLHSHDKRPALAIQDEQKFELSGYGFAGFSGDSNDNFRLEILHGDPQMAGSDAHVQAIYSKFRLVHANLGCAVFNSRRTLPKWAFGQTEVNCMRQCRPRMSTWHVEHAEYPPANGTADAEAQPVRRAAYRQLGLWAKIREYHQLMVDSNENLPGDHPFAARPQHWPWLRRGTAYWGGRGRLVYQLGNPPIWWGSLAALTVFGALQVLLLLLDKSGVRMQLGGQRAQHSAAAGFFAVAWATHYVPFFLMGRDLFIHHYFPALWMAIMVLAFSLDLATCRAPRAIRAAVYAAAAAVAVHAFVTFSHITYARPWTKDACLRAKWLGTWDFECEHAIGGALATESTPAPTSIAADEAAAQPDTPAEAPAEAPAPEALSSPNDTPPVYVEPRFETPAASNENEKEDENDNTPPEAHPEL
ncbi:Dolichyl-phosphate-mannose--protein mannosyltransferase 1 [Coemansia nantahalensis]|nr:Dolichyl-phosphate-mannose--protein mannosyltransferase 1 [Coemansia nantahalensis]